jgi:3-dehydroquinate synthetase
MLAAFNLARRLNIYDREISNSEHGIEKLLEFISDESRDVVRNLDLEAFIDSLRFDKKSLDGAYVFILPSNSGLLEVPLPITEENDLLILSSMRHSLLQVSQ